MTLPGDWSDLQLYQLRGLMGQEEISSWQVSWGGKLAECHCGLVAGVATGAVEAVFEHLVGKSLTLGGAEVEVLEEVGDAGEEAKALDAARFGLAHELVDELATGTASFDIGTDDDGADLGEVRAIDVEGCTAEELMGVSFDDGEGAYIGADFGVGAGKEGAVVREAVDQLMDGVGVLQLRFASSEEDGFEVTAEGGGAVLRSCERNLCCC
jgi:hypothetical protein